ncbi:MAG: hypothetical protein GYA61_03185 [Spirochaetales bacterium]|nr:hypothetical protein [Spirochaetales bacterium]
MTKEISKITLSFGFNFFIRKFKNENSKVSVLIIPDISETISLYDDFIEKLIQRNLSVTIFDLPGQGLSDGKRGGFYRQEVFFEIFEKLFSSLDLKNGIHIYTSGVTSPYIIKILYDFLDKIWIRSIFISGFTFSINYSFFLRILFKSFLSKFRLDLYQYLKDKTDDKKNLKKITTSSEITRFIDIKMFLSFLFSKGKALKLIKEKPVPIFIAFGKNQKAFAFINEKLKNNNTLKSNLKIKLPIKFFLYDGGHSIHLSRNTIQDQCLTSYFDFISLC